MKIIQGIYSQSTLGRVNAVRYLFIFLGYHLLKMQNSFPQNLLMRVYKWRKLFVSRMSCNYGSVNKLLDVTPFVHVPVTPARHTLRALLTNISSLAIKENICPLLISVNRQAKVAIIQWRAFTFIVPLWCTQAVGNAISAVNHITRRHFVLRARLRSADILSAERYWNFDRNRCMIIGNKKL